MYKLFFMKDADEWLKLIKSFDNNDVYYYPQYFKAFEDNGEGTPILFYMENIHGRVVNAFLRRDICKDQFFNKLIKPSEYFDISTVYGYGGPLYETNCLDALSKEYNDEFSDYCLKNNIVSEFIRFHPLLENYHFLKDYFDVRNIRSTVYMDLRNGEEYIWEDFKSENRTRIRKAKKSGIEIVFGREQYLIETFKVLYMQTMIRDNASDYYFFNEHFFNTTLDMLNENSFIAAAKCNGSIIAASIIMFNDKYVHYHFGGSDREYMKYAPNNLILYEVANWGCRTGRQFFHLGGGYKGDEDSLFRFKKSFSTSNKLPFYIGKRIYNRKAYDFLLNQKLTRYVAGDIDEDYFPAYRIRI